MNHSPEAKISDQAIQPGSSRLSITCRTRRREMSEGVLQLLLAEITGEVHNPLARDEEELALIRAMLAAIVGGMAIVGSCWYGQESFVTSSIAFSCGSFLVFVCSYHYRPIRRQFEWLKPVPFIGVVAASVAVAVTILAHAQDPEELASSDPSIAFGLLLLKTFVAAATALAIGCLAGWLLKRKLSRSHEPLER